MNDICASLWNNSVIGTLAVDGWLVMFGTQHTPPHCTDCNVQLINS